MDAKQRVDKLLDKKRNIEQEIEHIQSNCKHINKVIKQVQINNSFNLRWTCEDCNAILGYPTQFDLDKLSEKKH